MIYFRALGRHDGEIRIKRNRGVDGAVVSYPGADGGEVGGASIDMKSAIQAIFL